MRRSTRNRDCQKSPNQPQTKEKAIKPRKARKESSEAKVGTQDTPAVVPDSQGESYEGTVDRYLAALEGWTSDLYEQAHRNQVFGIPLL